VRASAEIIPLAVAAAAFAGVAVLVVHLSLRKHLTPAARERRRRLDVGARGRMAGATVFDVREEELFYTYSVGGVEYSATQDVSSIREHLPKDAAALAGPATVKYISRNPANSIVVCEEWSGLRGRKGASPE
jgi:hypothetical protein